MDILTAMLVTVSRVSIDVDPTPEALVALADRIENGANPKTEWLMLAMLCRRVAALESKS